MIELTTAEQTAGISSTTTIKPYFKTLHVAAAMYGRTMSHFVPDFYNELDESELFNAWVLLSTHTHEFHEEIEWLSEEPNKEQLNHDTWNYIVDVQAHELEKIFDEHPFFHDGEAMKHASYEVETCSWRNKIEIFNNEQKGTTASGVHYDGTKKVYIFRYTISEVK